MPHHFFEIGSIVLLAALAAIFLSRLKQQPMIGYVLAGLIIGPAFLRLVNDEKEISFIAEIGVILLLFILGMELPLKSFRQSYKVALPVTFSLVLLSLGIVFVIGLFVSLSLEQTIVYGFIIALSSTAVAVKLLEDVDLLSKGTGQIAISVLIAQDLLFVPMIMITNAMGNESGIDIMFVPKIAAAVAVLIALIAFLSKKEKIHLLFHKRIEKHKDLIPVAALAWCFVGAGLSEWAGLSPAYGAFLAGLIIGNSYSKEKIMPQIEPMQSVLLMVFFLSIGMLIDLNVIADNATLIFMLLFGGLVFKTTACILLLKFFLPEDRWRCSFVTGLTISQIGEFSFILAAAALGNEIFSDENYKIIVAVIALNLAFSPLWLAFLRRFVEVAYSKKLATSLGSALRISAFSK
ncbi:cation:proton antiporter [Kordiimonas pumila]|uniref:Cation:proton antiporter n=1 Tax=Kordiimonas pumila TaxID=2161677 RepID=A0ABV7D4P6_9PROT|nr:cation:proton antiporter [Kordiimonas pumila]